MRPRTSIELSGGDAAKMQKPLDVLEDLDDAQEVYQRGALIRLLFSCASNVNWRLHKAPAGPRMKSS